MSVQYLVDSLKVLKEKVRLVADLGVTPTHVVVHQS